jgi:hypothetical protein
VADKQACPEVTLHLLDRRSFGEGCLRLFVFFVAKNSYSAARLRLGFGEASKCGVEGLAWAHGAGDEFGERREARFQLRIPVLREEFAGRIPAQVVSFQKRLHMLRRFNPARR